MPLQTADPLILQAALIGLQQMKADIDAKMSHIRQRLGTEPAAEGPASKKAAPKKRKRRLSAAGRANIIAALKKRWAERRQQEERAQAAPKNAGLPVKRTAARKPAPRKTGKSKPAPAKAPVRTAPPAEAWF